MREGEKGRKGVKEEGKNGEGGRERKGWKETEGERERKGRGREGERKSNVRLSSYLFVVVQNSVHVFNPNGIHGPIKHDPLAILRQGGRLLPEGVGQDAVGPLVAHLVEAPVQLPHGDGLGVDDLVLHGKLPHLVSWARRSNPRYKGSGGPEHRTRENAISKAEQPR